MAVTAQQIAELAGVSRGTVDRALHNRGRVNPEVSARILQIAKDLGYKPNMIGQALVRNKQVFLLGMILQSAETTTMQDVSRGAAQSAEELRASGADLLIKEIKGLDAEKVLEAIDELLKEGVRGLAIAPNNAPELVERINELHHQGIPVVTLNSDAPGSRRLCFIGMDNYRAGQTAAVLLRQMLPNGGKVFTLTGHLNNTAHSARVSGCFEALASEGAEDIQLLPFQPCFDRDDYAHEITQHILQTIPDLSAIYVTANGQQGVCQAVEEAGLKGRVRVIAYDLNAPNRQLLRNGSLSFAIDQAAFQQGALPPMVLFDALCRDKPPAKEFLYTDILIRTKYNLPDPS